MSVSDIVAIKQDGKVSCHYCDSVGFTPIPGFFSQNPLKNAEMVVEDDYGMIDGIINNGAKEPKMCIRDRCDCGRNRTGTGTYTGGECGIGG